MTENGVVRLLHPRLNDFRKKVGDPCAGQTVIEINVGGAGEEILKFCELEKRKGNKG